MPMPLKDLTGKRFGRLTVIGRVPKFEWRCVCDCGTERVIHRSRLLSGSSKSCGCLRRELRRAAMTTHGQRSTREYRVWGGMKNRCFNANNKNFGSYGARGITVCERWRDSFAAFLEDMGRPPSASHQIDRINNDGNYEPGNCRWAMPAENSRNRRSTVVITYDGVTKAASEWANDLGMNRHAILDRLKKGWSVKDAITTPATPRKLRIAIARQRAS